MSEEKKSSNAGHVMSIVVIVFGVVFVLAGIGTWFAVSAALADENITVPDDAERFAGQQVKGPLQAYETANVINHHALAATDGLTYAQMDRDDPARQTAMTASFLRSSLFTSVVAFGVAAMAVGVGLVLILVGATLLMIFQKPEAPKAAPATT